MVVTFSLVIVKLVNPQLSYPNDFFVVLLIVLSWLIYDVITIVFVHKYVSYKKQNFYGLVSIFNLVVCLSYAVAASSDQVLVFGEYFVFFIQICSGIFANFVLYHKQKAMKPKITQKKKPITTENA